MLLERIQHRLEIKVLDHNAREPYAMADVHSAAAHILEGTAVNALNPLLMTLPAPAQTGIKPKNLNSILDKFVQMILAVLATKPYKVP